MARPQRQLPFSQCHFVGFLPSSRLHSSFSEMDPFFFMQLLQHGYFWIFFSGSSMFRSQKRFQNVPKQKRRSGEECYFDTDLPGNNRYRSLDKAEESDKIQKEQIQSQFFATALFNAIIKIWSIFRPTPVYKMVDSRLQA